MEHIELIEKTKAFLQQYIAKEDIGNDDEIFGSGLVNSLFAMQLVMFLEKNFEIKIDNNDLDLKNFRSLNSIADFVFKKQKR